MHSGRVPESNGKLAFLLMCVSFVIAGLLLFFVKPDGKIAFDQASAVGANTVDYYAANGDYPVHCADDNDIDLCLEGLRSRGQANTAVWLGNSQLHAINQLKADEVSSAYMLHHSLLSNGWDMLTLSQPNANLQEHYVLFEYLSLQVELKGLLLPVVFDDTREDGLRDSVRSFIDRPGMKSRMATTPLGARLVADDDQSLQADDQASHLSWQDRSEASLNQWLANMLPLWGLRAELRSAAFFGLYRLRNSLFGISATTKRKVLPGPYATNMASLEALLTRARAAGTKALVYIAPIRHDVELPYDDAQYANFVREVEQIARSHGAQFINFEKLVDAEDWGATGSLALGGAQSAGIDFMHFKAAGHKILAQTLLEKFNELVDGSVSDL